MRKLMLIPLMLVSAGIVYAQSTVSGHVYEDANGNGGRDRRERGLSGVAVSNGIQVVTTDADGRYELPVRSEERRVGKEC